MDIEQLSVMNSLYNLEITDEEFKNIADEVSHTERSGISIKAVKNGKVIGINHDSKKQDIFIKEYKCVKIKPNTRILLKTLVNFDELPQEIYTLHSILRYRALDMTIKHTARNLKQLKECFLKRLSDEYPKLLADEIYDLEYQGYDDKIRDKFKEQKKVLIEEQLKAIYWLFEKDYDFKLNDKLRVNVPTIVKVFEWNTYRLAIIQENEEFEKVHNGFFKQVTTENCRGVKLSIKTYKPNDEKYDYVDVGREIYFEYEKEVWVCSDDLLGNISVQELELIKNKLTNQERKNVMLTKDIYNQVRDSLRIEILKAKRDDSQEQAKEIARKKVREQFQKGELCRSGITLKKDRITYNGVTLKSENILNYISNSNILYRDNLVFQNLYFEYVSFTLKEKEEFDYRTKIERVNLTKPINFSIGNVRVEVKKRNKNFYVNGLYKVRSDEIERIMQKAIIYSDTESYNKFLEEVSRVSLRLKNALNNGLIFTLKISADEDNCLITEKERGESIMTLPLKMKDKKVYAEIIGKEFRVKDINALFDLEKEIDTSRYYGNMLNRAIKLLYKSLEGISPQEIGEIIKECKIENLNRIERSKQFVENAIRISKAETMTFQNVKGWVVQGKSKKVYFIGSDLKVWELQNKDEVKKARYVCIVDDKSARNDEALKQDYIAKRILFLYNDNDVKAEIHTLQISQEQDEEDFEDVDENDFVVA